MDPFIAEIRIFPFNFAPKGWAFCNGQLLPISQNTALFSLLGTTYGGDGHSNFALPNLQGNAPMHQGQGPGLSLRNLGESGGEDTVTLLATQLPTHAHTANSNAAMGDQYGPPGNLWAKDAGGNNEYDISAHAAAKMAPGAVQATGGSQPHNNLQPYLTLNFCIAMQGVFPPRT
jgi:microcystin-dependent protein